MDRQFPEAERLFRYAKISMDKSLVKNQRILFSFVEYAALTRLGLGDPKSFCRKRFKEISLLYLSSCCVGSNILEQIEAAIEEAINSQSWIEVLVSTSVSAKKATFTFIYLFFSCSLYYPVYLMKKMPNRLFNTC